jgi:arylformamidase
MKFIDLTHSIEEGMQTFNAPWHPIVEITQMGRLSSEGRQTCKFVVGSHTGTHMDAPLHFIRGGNSIDQIPFSKIFGDVSIIDFSYLQEKDKVTVALLEQVRMGKKVIFNFGWSRYWNTRKFYKNYPFFSPEAAQYLVEKKVELIGMDTPSPDDSRIVLSGENLGSEFDSPIHKLLLKNDIVILEYLANLDKIKDDFLGWKIIAMPLKVKGADGAPARVYIYKEEQQ